MGAQSEHKSEPPDPAASVDPRTVRGLILLTLIAGMVDAVTFIALEQVFAANMTGNLAVLGFAIAGAPALNVDGPAVALAAFLLGAALFGRIDPGGESRRSQVVKLVVMEAVVIGAAAAIAIGYEDDSRRLLLIALIAGVMGVRNETIRRINVPELRTTVLTLAIAGFAAHEAEGAFSWRDRLRVIGIAVMVAGALGSGLLVLNTALVWPLLAIVAVELVTLAVLRGARGRQPLRSGR